MINQQTCSPKDLKQLGQLTVIFKNTLKTKGPLEEWTNSVLKNLRDKFRLAARKTRGNWTFDFYESLQALNKEGIKRNL
jgi:hypothetical protein